MQHAALGDEDLVTQIVDYSHDYPEMISRSLGEVSYGELRSGTIALNGQKISTAPLSSYFKAREIANLLKEWIERGDFFLGEPQQLLPSAAP